MTATSTVAADQLFEQAQTVLAAGVSAGMRVNPYLGKPLFIERGEGAYLYDVDSRRLIDFNMSNGAALLGHDHPAVKQAVQHGVELGIICAAETPFHEQLAARMVEIIPAAERVRFSSVGTEATVVALRVARAATGRTPARWRGSSADQIATVSRWLVWLAK
jgi:glutamate-1-semialdehyde 2,1-aminomutase